MQAQHLTIVAVNRTGLIGELSALLGAEQINIADIQAQTHGEDAVIHLSVDKLEEALHLLVEGGDFHVVSDGSILLRMPDQPGALAGIAKQLADAQIDIRSLRVVQRHDGHGIIALDCDRNEAARAVLGDLLLS